MKSIEELLNLILKDFLDGKYDQFINKLTLLSFKNIKSKEKINFEFPLTVLVGENGIGKTSILHALFGIPEGYSTSTYWYPTPLDPDNETEIGNRPRYIYTYWNMELKKNLEGSKTKMYNPKRKDNEVYWEPRRPVLKDGMQPMQKNLSDKEKKYASQTMDRWSPPQRKSEFINQKTELGAFDRFSQDHIDDSNTSRIKDINNASIKLKRVIKNERDSYKLGGKQEKVFYRKKLNKEQLYLVNFILEKEYISAIYIKHSFYGNIKAPSVLFKNSHELQYSEAFAGSGELAIVSLIIKIFNAPEYSLILIDEPETSLHPGAQKRLLNVLLYFINSKKLQIVISSHSPAIVSLLPVNSIKVLEKDTEEKNNYSKIIENIHHSVAFKRLGHKHENINIFCEDALLKIMIEVAIKDIDPGIKDALNIQIASTNGADEILTNLSYSWFKSNSEIYCFVDGDKKNALLSLPDTNILNKTEIKSIKTIYKTATNFNIPKQFTNEETVEFIDWFKKRIFTIDCLCPEEIFYELITKTKNNNFTNQEYKDKVNELIERDGHQINSTTLSILFRSKLIEELNNHDAGLPVLNNIKSKILHILNL